MPCRSWKRRRRPEAVRYPVGDSGTQAARSAVPAGRLGPGNVWRPGPAVDATWRYRQLRLSSARRGRTPLTIAAAPAFPQTLSRFCC